MSKKPDHLDREVSVSAEVTPTGVKASAKSRLVSALDRLGGNLTEAINVRLEEGAEKRRLRMESERKLIEAAVRSSVKRIATDNEFAERALGHHLEQVFQKQLNKDEVASAAVEDLRRQPPTEDQAQAGPDELAPEFEERFNRYAEEAYTEELRQKWGRVLAAEIREPGLVTNRVMRVIDELDATTALLFETVCANRVGDALPLALLEELSFDQQSRLIQSGLLADSGLGIIKSFARQTLTSGEPIWICYLYDYAIVIPVAAWHNQAPAMRGRHQALVTNDNSPAVPAEVLTPVGQAVAKILPDRQEATLARLIAKIRGLVPDTRAYRRAPEGDTMNQFEPEA